MDSSFSPYNDTNSSCSSPPIWKHHVYPSFHGPDVRRSFLSHILESFRRKGIDQFIDNHIPRGVPIGPELIEGVRGSKIAIVFLSKNYASSSWCLDELLEIMKCREELSQIVMTIFYGVDPTEVKKQTGDFGEAFRETCENRREERTERWRKALEDVARIAGEHSCNWSDEAAMIEKIANDVSNMLNRSTPSSDFVGLVGMRAHMEMMKQLLRLDLDEVRMIGIWGELVRQPSPEFCLTKSPADSNLVQSCLISKDAIQDIVWTSTVHNCNYKTKCCLRLSIRKIS